MGIRANDNTKTERVMKTLAKYDLDSSAVWDCHGTPVIFHWACERIAEKIGIEFDPPTLIDQDTGKKQITILVKGHNGDRSEWSFGEVTAGNCKNAYPWAMAEKRAKDRVILKLAGLSGDVYSEEESDDFKPGKPEAVEQSPPYPKMSQAAHKREGTYEEVVGEIMQCRAPDELRAWRAANTERVRSLPKKWIDPINDAYAEHLETLKAMTDGVLNDVA